MYVARMTYVYVCELYVYASMSKDVHVCNNFFKSHSICTYMHVYISICMYIARLLYVYVCELYVQYFVRVVYIDTKRISFIVQF